MLCFPCCRRARTSKVVIRARNAREDIVEAVLAASRMIATEGLGENQRAHGFLFIIGNSEELLAPDPDLTYAETESSVHSKYGFFPKDLDRRDSTEILIQDCCQSDAKKRALQTLCGRDNAIVVDGTTGRVCCGGFANRDITTPYGTGSRTRAASSIAVKANCVTIKASQDICGTRANPIFLDAHFEVFRGKYDPDKVPVVVAETPSAMSDEATPWSFGSCLLAIQRHVVAIKRLEASHRCALRPHLHRKYGTDEYAKVRAKITEFEDLTDDETVRFYVDERRVEEFRDLETGFEEFCRGLPTVYPVAAVLSVENEAIADTRIPLLMRTFKERDVATYFHPELELVEFVRGVGPRILIFVGCPLDGVRCFDEEWRLCYFCSSAQGSDNMLEFDQDNLVEFVRSVQPECVLLLAHNSIELVANLSPERLAEPIRLIVWKGRMNRRSASKFVDTFIHKFLANFSDDGLDCIQSSYLRGMQKVTLDPGTKPSIKLLPDTQVVTDRLGTSVPDEILIRLKDLDLLSSEVATAIRDTYVPQIVALLRADREKFQLPYTAMIRIAGRIDDSNVNKVKILLDDLKALRVDFEFTTSGSIVYHCVVSDNVEDFRGWGQQVAANLAEKQTIRIAELALTGVIVKTADLQFLRDEFPAECAEAVHNYQRSDVLGEKLLSLLLQPTQDLTIDAINDVAARCEEQLKATTHATMLDVGPQKNRGDQTSEFGFSSNFENDKPAQREEGVTTILEAAHTEGVGEKKSDAFALAARPSSTQHAAAEAKRRHQGQIARVQHGRCDPKQREKVERVNAAVDSELDIITTILTIGKAIPLVGGICGVAKEILEDVRKNTDKADDVVRAGCRVLDVLEFLRLLQRRVDELSPEPTPEVREAMKDITQLLEEFKTAVQKFGKPGFFKRFWRLRKYAGALSRLDEKMRNKLDFLTKAYGVARDARVEGLLRAIPYKLEEALKKYVDERHDNDQMALEDAAEEGDVDPEETRAALVALHQKVDELEKKRDYSLLLLLLEEQNALIKRALERSDNAAIRNAGRKVSDVMSETSLLPVYEKCLVLQLLAASFADDAKRIQEILDVAPTIIHEQLSDVGGACWALSALHVSALCGNLAAIMKLQNMNGDFTIADAHKRTPLHHAAARGHVEVVSYLLRHCGVDVDAKDRNDRTPLMFASYKGKIDVVERLVNVGKADVNVGFDDDDGIQTAIDLALCRGHEDVVNFLDERGARRLSAPIPTNTSGDPLFSQTLHFRESLFVGGVGRTRSVRLQSSNVDARSRSGEDFDVLVDDQPVAGEKHGVAADSLPGKHEAAEHNDVDPAKPTKKLQRSLGNFDVGHLVRLPTTGRPVFEVVDFIAKGAHGEVYVVRSTTRASSAMFAMKRVRSDDNLKKKKDLIEKELRLCREALLMAELGTHPHIVWLHYCIVSSNNAEFLIFMTLVDAARDLERLVSSGDLYDGDTRAVRENIFSILQQLASALSFCHSRGVLHQDVKLENVLVDTAGCAYLGGFGLARRGDGIDANLRAPLEGYSPGYESPEIVAALGTSSGRARVSPAETDVWAFGVVALHLYHAGEVFFPEMQTALESIVALAPPDTSWGGLEVDAWLRKHSLSVQEENAPPDGAALFKMSPNNLHDALPWLPKKKDRLRLRRMLLAPPPAMSILLRQCFAADVTERPTCGAALLEKMVQVPGTSMTHNPVEDVAETLLNIGRAVVELNDVDLARRALEASVANGGDAAECYALIANAQLRAGRCEEALVACDRALSNDEEHGGALFVKAEATYRRDSSDYSLFPDVIRRARLYDAKLFPAPRAVEGAIAYLEAAKDEADSARDPVTNDRVSVSACVRDLPPNIAHRRDVKTEFGGSFPPATTTTVDYSSVRGALGDVVHAGEAVDAAMRTGRVVMEGDTGSGKGWFLRAFVVALCKKQLDDNGSGESTSTSEVLLPLTIPLSSIENPNVDWLGGAINSVRDGGDALRAARIHQRLVLCLDGLDEVSPDARPSLVEKIVVEYARGCAFTIITSRPAAGNVGDLAPHGFAFLSIAQVDRRRVEDLGIPSDVASLVETPLSLRLASLALSSSSGELQRPGILRDRSDLFRIATEEFVARAVAPTQQDGTLAVARDVLRECGSSKVREVFERIALAAHEDRRTLIQRSDLQGLASHRLAAAVWSLARSGVLPPFVPRGSNSVAFFHLTFQENYVARMLGSDALLVEDAFDLGDPWWQSPALFAFQLAEPRGRERALDALSRKIPALVAGDRVEVCSDEFRFYFPRTVASLDEFVSSRKIGVKEYSWSETQVVSVEQTRRDVEEVAALARRAAAEGETALVAGLLDRGADLITPVDSTTKDSALHAAARSGRAECARFLLRAGASLYSRNKFGSNPRDLGFSRAVEVQRRADMVRIFDPPQCDKDLDAHPIVPYVLEWVDSDEVSEKIPREWSDELRLYAFAQACHRRQERAATTLASFVDVNGRFPRGVSVPLHFAVVNSCTNAVSVLLERGARLHDIVGESALALASRLNRVDALSVLLQEKNFVEKSFKLQPGAQFGSRHWVRALMEKGADALSVLLHKNQFDEVSFVLLPAAQFGFIECVRVLIKKGADVDKATTNNGLTPLYMASQNGHVDCVRVLIDKGADVDKAWADDGTTPLFAASRNGHVDCVRVLIEKGADIDKAKTDNGATPLCAASLNGHVDCIRVLIEKGADVDKATTDDGATPLCAASLNGHVDCIRVLIEKGADVDKATTDTGVTPLYMASQNGHVDCVRVLIEKGADVDKARTDDGVTPLYMASQNGHVDCVRVLIENGADVDKARTDHGTTPLYVASESNQVECVRVLIENDADVNKAQTDIGATPLYVASESNHVDCVRVLIENGADVDKARTDDSTTPLHVASLKGHVDCIRLLIEKGADVDKATTDTGVTPLFATSQNGHVDCVRVLIENGADVDKARTDHGTTPLYMASLNGHVDCVRVLIENGADVDKARTDDGTTPLHVASEKNHVDCVRALIAKGADVDKATTDTGATPLFMASLNGHVDCVRVLIEKGADVDKATTDTGMTPLFAASLNGHVDCVLVLIEKGADVDKATTDTGMTPLFAASLNGHVDCVLVLIEKGADVDKATTDHGVTPLYMASQNGHVDCVRVLIEKGADVDKATTDHGVTPLYMASQNGHVDCVRVLIENGADVDKARTDHGTTPLYMASLNGHVDCVRVLIENGADVDKARTDDGTTPLHVASEKNHVDCVRALIAKGADVDKATTDTGATPLFMASLNGHVDCVRVLIEKGADVDKATTDTGMTPLFAASLNGHVDCVLVLIEKGADVDKATTDHGVTPLYMASQNGHVDCVRVLIEKGADVDKARTDIGETPLYVASESNQVECVQVLIENDADVNKARTDIGATPLYVASEKNHVECIRVLIEKGADVNKARTDDGTTPLHVASEKNHVECVRALIAAPTSEQRPLST